jgi:putative ABC transport system permease protein
MNQVILMGLDDATLIGRPLKMIMGQAASLAEPNAMILDRAGYEYLWPGETMRLRRTAEINDRRVLITGVAEASPPFVTFPVVFTRYSEAMRLTPPQRNKMSFVLVKAAPGVSASALAERISQKTGLQALTWQGFTWRSINYYLERTGIPVNFGITVALGFIVGAAVAGQTFYIFVIENLRQFGALKAIGVTDGQILSMVLLQAVVVGAIGFGLGIGFCALFFAATSNVTALRGFILRPEIMAGTGAAVTVIMAIASLASIRKVFVLEPAIVFRG